MAKQAGRALASLRRSPQHRPVPPSTPPQLPDPAPASILSSPPPDDLRIRRPGLEPRAAPIEILVDGRAVPALEGETVAAALTAAGQLALRHHAQGGERGLYCGMGACFDCRVSIDGRPGERACLAPVRAGMRVQTLEQGAASDAQLRPEPGLRLERTQVLVVGAGPAGLAAAEAAAESGLHVLVLDERPAPGGQYFKPVASSHKAPAGRHPDEQFRRGAMMVDRVRALGVRIASRCTVWDAEANVAEGGAVVRAIDGEGPLEVEADALVIASGAYERPWPVPGWTLPGVMTTGAAQTLARSYQVAPGRRILVAGNGPLNLQVAADLARSGMQVVAVAEAARAPWRASPSDLISLARTRADLLRDGLRGHFIVSGQHGYSETLPAQIGDRLARRRPHGVGHRDEARKAAINRRQHDACALRAQFRDGGQGRCRVGAHAFHLRFTANRDDPAGDAGRHPKPRLGCELVAGRQIELPLTGLLDDRARQRMFRPALHRGG